MKFNWILLVTVALSHVALGAEPPKHQPGNDLGTAIKERLEAKDPKNQISADEAGDIPVVEGCLVDPAKSIVDRWKAGQSVGFNEVTDAVIAIHQSKQPSMDMKALDTMLRSIRTAGHVSRESLLDMKGNYEAMLQAKLGKDIAYNMDSTSITDICTKGSTQCYSGTVLNQIIARKVLAKLAFSEKNPVVIFTEGHVLPGFMTEVKNEDGSRKGFNLTGIETTEKGIAPMNFGLTNEFGAIAATPENSGRADRQVKVVRAQDWIISELVKDCLVQNSQKFAEARLNAAADEYGINGDFARKSEPVAMLPVFKGFVPVHAIKKPDLNWSPFAFGQAPVIKGDIQRSERTAPADFDYSAPASQTIRDEQLRLQRAEEARKEAAAQKRRERIASILSQINSAGEWIGGQYNAGVDMLRKHEERKALEAERAAILVEGLKNAEERRRANDAIRQTIDTNVKSYLQFLQSLGTVRRQEEVDPNTLPAIEIKLATPPMDVPMPAPAEPMTVVDPDNTPIDPIIADEPVSATQPENVKP